MCTLLYVYHMCMLVGCDYDTHLVRQKHLVGAVVSQAKIEEADAVISAHLGPGLFNRAGTYIRTTQPHSLTLLTH